MLPGLGENMHGIGPRGAGFLIAVALAVACSDDGHGSGGGNDGSTAPDGGTDGGTTGTSDGGSSATGGDDGSTGDDGGTDGGNTSDSGTVSVSDTGDPSADDYVAPCPQDAVEAPEYDEIAPPGPLRQKAEAYDAWHLEHHQPFHGGVVGTVFTDATRQEVALYSEMGDSAEWTGAYLVSQAARYHVTGEPQAKANAVRMAGTLSGYLHVTGIPGYIARYWSIQNEFYPGDEWCDTEPDNWCNHIEQGEFAGDWWLGETSRDMFNGWFMGLIAAYDLVDDEQMREQIRLDVAEVLDALIEHGWTIVSENGGVSLVGRNYQLVWTLIGYHITCEERFRTLLKELIRNDNRGALEATCNTTVSHYMDYFANCLHHELWYNLLRLGKAYFGPDDYNYLVDLFESNIHTFTRLSHNPFFNTVFMSQGAYAPAPGDEYEQQLVQDLTDFRDPPNHRYYLPARDPATYTLDPLSIPFGGQATEAFPVNLQCSYYFLWQRNPFIFDECGEDRPEVVNAGVDYLIAYWLASYHKLVNKTQ